MTLSVHIRVIIGAGLLKGSLYATIADR
jgi:hypothetical protein